MSPDDVARSLMGRIREKKTRDTLELLHKVCREEHAKLGKSLSARGAALATEKRGGPTVERLWQHFAYRALLNAWETHATEAGALLVYDPEHMSARDFLRSLHIKVSAEKTWEIVAFVDQICRNMHAGGRSDFSLRQVAEASRAERGPCLGDMWRSEPCITIVYAWEDLGTRTPEEAVYLRNPGKVLTRLKRDAPSEGEVKVLDFINTICDAQSHLPYPDFSLRNIGDLSVANDGPSREEIRVNTAYRFLVKTWGRQSKGKKEPYVYDPDKTGPEELYEKLKSEVPHTKTVAELDLLQEVCRKEAALKGADLSTRHVAKLLKEANGPTYRTLCANPYLHDLRYAWAEEVRRRRQQFTYDPGTMTPDELHAHLRGGAYFVSTQQSLDIIHGVCRELCESHSHDFSYGCIAKMSEVKGGPSYNSLTNSPTYTQLIQAWRDCAGYDSEAVQKSSDLQFRHIIIEHGTSMEEWRQLAIRWIKSDSGNASGKKAALNAFFDRYIVGCALDRNPLFLLKQDKPLPSFFSLLQETMAETTATGLNNQVSAFLDWVLIDLLATEDDNGRPIVPAEYFNPVPRVTAGGRPDESIRKVLPYRYVQELRDILAPGENFRDWKWAHDAVKGTNRKGGDWFEVDKSIIDEKDPDCVWRTRFIRVSRKGRTARQREVVELWSPVRAVALLVKLLIPLRTFQVRMLDSGESDTWRYENWGWGLSDGPLAQGSERKPHARGVFRRVFTQTEGEMTALFINTNKTADIDKEEARKGYVIPWQNPILLRVLEKVRNWQEKYNPIVKPSPWSLLKARHLGNVKSPEKLKTMGASCFLFRDATREGRVERALPVTDTQMAKLWFHLLSAMEERCAARGETLLNGDKLRFVQEKSDITTFFPLHALRVSLITAYALEGGVPVVLLAKLAGHSRFIMTLFYTKAGIAHVTKVMHAAEARIEQGAAEAVKLFLQNASLQQLETSTAYNDSVAVRAITETRNAAGWSPLHIGLCPTGCAGCSTGGENLSKRSGDPIHAPTPGYPTEKNCVRCRWFITEPRYLTALQAHFNNKSYKLTEHADRLIQLENCFLALQDVKISCERTGEPFVDVEEFNEVAKNYEEAQEKTDLLMHDMHATYKLIVRCLHIAASRTKGDDAVKLVAAGTISDIQIVLEETDSELLQLSLVCENAEIYPAEEPSKATLRRSQLLDSFLEQNGRFPIFYRLSEREQLLVGNEMMRHYARRLGGMKEAVGVIDTGQALRDAGLLDSTIELLEAKTGKSLRLLDCLDSSRSAKEMGDDTRRVA